MTHPDSTLFSAYMDGDLGPREAQELEEHLRVCESCAGLLEELLSLQDRARSLPDRFPPRDLWPAIAESIEEQASWEPGSPDVIRLHPRLPEAVDEGRRGIHLSTPRAVAAGIVLALASGALGAWLGPRTGPRMMAGTDGPGTEMVAPWVSLVESARPDLVPATQEIARLERVLLDHRDVLDSLTVSVLERNLEVIDRAIQESLDALRDDPGNTFLESNLERAVLAKSEYLRDAAALVTPIT
jgi:anti-sigma factor RsiW